MVVYALAGSLEAAETRILGVLWEHNSKNNFKANAMLNFEHFHKTSCDERLPYLIIKNP